MAQRGLTVRGLPELELLFAAAGPVAQKDLNARLRDLAELIRADAEGLATVGITRIGPRWSRMRVGITRKAVYVAPRQRGARGRGNKLSRPRFADLMEQRAMGPALERNIGRLEQATEELFEGLARDWNRKG